VHVHRSFIAAEEFSGTLGEFGVHLILILLNTPFGDEAMVYTIPRLVRQVYLLYVSIALHFCILVMQATLLIRVYYFYGLF